MKNISTIIAAFAAILITAILVVVMVVISTANQETAISTALKQKQRDNMNANDRMWKTIDQVAQTTEAQKEALKEIFNGYAEARGANTSQPSAALATWINEAVPNVDTDTFKNLQNIITSQRESFAMRQTELLDLKRSHDKLLQSIPSNIILASLGREPIDVVIITSTRTENSFETGRDDDIQLFNKTNK